jgi:hypothetical protein
MKKNATKNMRTLSGNSPERTLILFCMMAFFMLSLTAGFKTYGQGDGQWRQLFNGKDLTGWKHVGPGERYVEDGLLKSKGGMGLLYWTGEKFGNCKIRVVYKMRDENSNAGVFIRIPIEPREEWMPVHYGYEVQIDNKPETSNEDEYHYTGTLYSLTKPLAKPGKPGPEWNTMEITLDGLRTIVYVNGIKVTDFKEGDPVPERKFDFEPFRGPRPEFGYIGIQNHGDTDVVFFKEVSVQPLKKEGKQENYETKPDKKETKPAKKN